ncbi:MAG TPA: putative sulfate exporter family transporter [Paraburkholderia sp.]|uniref:YeiH family protein n=1 Tax=Paraburkholderia sp. TaxID=1926495 RepID=UPI002CB09E29|nr:putative sulfate exporter family transporter [Paraburkholderia sp.]HTR06238.1 putative sulfate exporter family transporter [Paraburkholderia sp.]
MSNTTLAAEGGQHADGQAVTAQRRPFGTEDWWAVAIALFTIALAWALFASGGSIKSLAVAPARWNDFGALGTDLAAHAVGYLALFVAFAVVFTVAIAALGLPVAQFLGGFLVLFVVSALIFIAGAWAQASRFNLEPPLLALALGLIVSNVFKSPAWLRPALRVEFYIKVGIVLLGATLPLTLIAWAGPVAVGQAGIVSLVTFFVIYGVARALKIEQRFAAVLGVGGAVCGVSAAIAIAGAVRARREQASVAITLVVVWAIVMVFALPALSRAFGLPTGIAGAWIGTSEFADAAGIAAAQAYGDLARHASGAVAGAPEAALQAFVLMKVVGRDIWIGIWAFVLAIVATTRWDRESGDNVQTTTRAREIWTRFPKFVIGFVIASAFVTWVASHYTLADYRSVVTPAFIAPIVALRTWAFTFCFLSIGLTTRFSALSATGARPFVAFTAGVAVNVVIGYLLSAHVFAPYWLALGK